MSRAYISSFHIAYPSLPSLHCNELSPGLNVIFGPNEAGKSRTKDFIEWLMFTYEGEHPDLKPAQRKNAFAHLTSGISGSSVVAIDGQRVELTHSRDNDRSIIHSNSSQYPLSEVASALTDGISREHYNQVFALTLDELNALRSNKLMTQDELAEVFLSASQTGSGVSLSSFVSTLRSQRDEMFSESGNARNRDINKVLKQIQDVTKEINQLRRGEGSAPQLEEEVTQRNRKVDELTIVVEELKTSLAEKRLIASSYEEFESYQQLLSQDSVPTNDELAHKYAEIEVLNAEVKSALDQEHERELLIDQLEALEREQEEQSRLLAHTLDPELLNEYAHSPDFLSVVKRHEKTTQDIQRDLARVRDKFQDQSRELSFITQESEKLQETLDAPRDTVFDAPIEVPIQSKRSIRPYGYAGLLLGVGILGAGLASAAIALIAAGVVVCIASLAVALLSPSHQIPVVEAARVSTDEYAQISAREKLASHQTQVEHFQVTMNELLDQQQQLEKSIEESREGYNNALLRAGFMESLDTNLIDIYLGAYTEYHARKQRITHINSDIEKYNRHIDQLLERTEELRGFAIGTSSEISVHLATLSAATTWLSSLLFTAKEFKENSDALHRKNETIRDYEKSLSSKFNGVEQATDIFSQTSHETLTREINEIESQLSLREEERIALHQEIGSLTNQITTQSTSTELIEAQQNKQELLEELSYLHKEYAQRVSATDIAESAFTFCQRENQPAVLRSASELLTTATRGAWNNVSIIYQERTKKEPVPEIYVSNTTTATQLKATQLSRGAQEQLYLCLRIALMRTSSKGKHTPVLLDDIGVNFDQGRFSSLTSLLSDISQERQVFYFTCHESARTALRQVEGARIIEI